jgi:predicted regulator of Ras-like GTPase activity (Roadblock/LC7/MglB family)
MSLDIEVSEFNWLLDTFVSSSAGVTDAVAVSSDGLLMAQSATLNRKGAHQVAAIVSGLVSLGTSAGHFLDFSPVDQIIVAMGGGLLYVTAMGSAGCLGAITDPAYDMDDVGYQMGRFVERAIDMLTPQLVTELKQAVAAV